MSIRNLFSSNSYDIYCTLLTCDELDCNFIKFTAVNDSIITIQNNRLTPFLIGAEGKYLGVQGGQLAWIDGGTVIEVPLNLVGDNNSAFSIENVANDYKVNIDTIAKTVTIDGSVNLTETQDAASNTELLIRDKTTGLVNKLVNGADTKVLSVESGELSWTDKITFPLVAPVESVQYTFSGAGAGSGLGYEGGAIRLFSNGLSLLAFEEARSNLTLGVGTFDVNAIDKYESFALGVNALQSTTLSSSNFVLGVNALQNVKVCFNTVAIGSNCGRELDAVSINNILIGAYAGYNVVEGSNNIFIGTTPYESTLPATSNNNIVIGHSFGGNSYKVDCANNVVLGNDCLMSNTTHINKTKNIVIGIEAGSTMGSNSTGNIIIENNGNIAFYNNGSTLVNCIYFGNTMTDQNAPKTNSISIGHNTLILEDNVCILGSGTCTGLGMDSNAINPTPKSALHIGINTKFGDASITLDSGNGITPIGDGGNISVNSINTPYFISYNPQNTGDMSVFVAIPPLPTSHGVRGQLSGDTDNIYVCTDTDTWLTVPSVPTLVSCSDVVITPPLEDGQALLYDAATTKWINREICIPLGEVYFSNFTTLATITVTNANTWYPIRGGELNVANFTTTLESNNSGFPSNLFDMPASGQLRYIGAHTLLFHTSISLSSSIASGTGDLCRVAILKNGNITTPTIGSIASNDYNTNNVAVSYSFNKIVSLAQNDYVEIGVFNATSSGRVISINNLNILIMAGCMT